MSRYYVEPQEIEPRSRDGVCYSAPGEILVRTAERLLVWRKPGSVWSSLGQPHSYVPRYLHIISRDPHGARDYGSIGGRDLLSGGRLTKARLEPIMDKIREHLKLPWLKVEDIEPKKTFVVD